MMRFPVYQQPQQTSFWEGLLSGFQQGRDERNVQNAYTDALKYMGQPVDLANTTQTQSVQGVPTAADVGKGLGGPSMFNPNQPQNTNGLLAAAAANQTPQAPTAANVGSGLLGKQPATPQYFGYTPGSNQQQSPSYTYKKDDQGNDLQNDDGTFTAVTPDGQQHSVMADANTGYAIDPAHNPGTYDWYKSQDKSQQQATQPAGGATIKTTTTTSLMSPQQAAVKINQATYQAASDILKKYGPAAMKEIMPMLQQARDLKLAEHKQDYNTQQVSTLMQNFNKSQNPYERAMMAAQMKQYGIELDPKMISTLQPDYKLTTVDQDNQQSLILHDPKSGNIVLAASLPKGLNPTKKYTADLDYKKGVDVANINGQYGLQRTALAGQYSLAKGSSKSNGSNGKTSSGLTFDQYEKANKRYQEITDDIWNSSTPQERAMKANTYKDELNTIGQFLDKDVNNDVNYIMNNGR